MRMLAIYNGKNKLGRHDGDEFQREAWDFYHAHMPDNFVSYVDIRDGRIRREIKFHGGTGLDVLAIFDHGTPKGLPRMRESYKNVRGLAETIASVTDKITIILYACSCGRGWWWWKPKNKRNIEVHANSYNPRDGYAVALACELTKLGVDAEVFAHLTAGHTTQNPHIVRIGLENRLTGLIGRGRWVGPKDRDWVAWVAKMKTEYRFTFWH